MNYIKKLDGASELEKFLDSLPLKDAAKLLAIIENTENLGLTIAIHNQWVKKIENDLYEFRSEVGSNIQRALYFHEVNNRYIITHGFTKKAEKTPEKEKQYIREARRKFKEE